MGVVYLADDTRLSRRVALKSLPHAISPDSSARERLRREARAAAGLSHPGIATVYALEEIGDELYLACEYVPGPTLRSLLGSGPLPVPQIVDVALQLAKALQAAHSQGIVHRDLKPENVVRTPIGVVKILDFGVARVEGVTSARLTHTGTIIGTPAYMAPEQAQGDEADFRSDLFALGVMLYEMASGSNPFEARTVTATISRILEVDPPALSQVCGAKFEPLDPVVSVCLHKDREARYRSTQQLVDELETLHGDLPDVRDRTGRRRESHSRAPSLDRPQSAGPLWWRVHQLSMIALYIIATARVWQIKTRLSQPLPLWIFVAIGGGAMINGTMRSHLLFTEGMNPDRLSDERHRTRRFIVAVDVLIAAVLSVDGVLVVPSEAVGGLLTIALALGIVLASLLVEPATTDAAFATDRRQGKRRSGVRRPPSYTRRKPTGAGGRSD
jgi:serine/threonine-protein kinase